jgi:hypothetical protein
LSSILSRATQEQSGLILSRSVYPF